MGEVNRRSLKTRKMLRQAFIEKLKTVPFAKITVSDLTEACDINRGTFYTHYQDIYDLLGDTFLAEGILEGKMCINCGKETIERMRKNGVEHQTRDSLESIFRYIHENREMCLVAFQEMNISPNMIPVRQALLESNSNWQSYLEPCDPGQPIPTQELSEYITSGMIGLYIRFLKLECGAFSEQRLQHYAAMGARFVVNTLSTYYKIN